MEVFEYYKSFEHEIFKGKYTRFFLRLAGIAVGYFKEARNSFFGLEVYLLKSKFRIEGELRFP